MPREIDLKDIDLKILNKIKKTLKLANESKSEGEAQAAMLAAQRLLAKHDLTMEDVGDGEVTKKDKSVVYKQVSEESGRIPWWKKNLSAVIAENFRCNSMMQPLGYRLSAIYFLGLEEDVRIASEVYAYAEMMVDKLAKSYVGKVYRSGRDTKGVRNIFITGFIVGLQRMFEEQVEQEGWGLVLKQDALVVERHESMNAGEHKQTGIKPMLAEDEHAYRSGYDQGKNFASDKKGIEG
jgi:Protein of unknown function (DUF2786)